MSTSPRSPKVRNYMATRLVTLSPTMEINRAMHILLEQQLSGAPVLDQAQRLVGVLSSKDCLKAVLNASYYQELGGTVADYMSTEVETLPADLDLVDAARHFLNSHFRRFPVLEEGRVIGQISRADLLRALLQNWSD
ncbi:CBS domain-containing protein [Pseudomarimonas arenosa]|uniref:CBS domain-containing protein n=1 Tax=Pseudomarimonas arenosa TaxID=2774145 RepID=A0AAW3ZLR8_9GAMM|nr:CBS domain-containing protein [Pseudomarimonas arenosa]MBD8526122.1 CBS domain-containing protein [Pseudomarimonas arenosa]